jgi:hypothetical protein
VFDGSACYETCEAIHLSCCSGESHQMLSLSSRHSLRFVFRFPCLILTAYIIGDTDILSIENFVETEIF